MPTPTKHLVTSLKEYESAKSYLGSRGRIFADTETTGLDVRRDRVVGVGVLSGERAFYFAFRHGEGPNLPENLLGDLYANILPPTREQVGHNYVYDIHIGKKDGHVCPERWHCTQTRQHLLVQDEPLKLESICEKYLDETAGESERELETLVRSRYGGTKHNWKNNLWRLPASEVFEYGTQDVISDRELFDYQTPLLQKCGLEDYYEEIQDYARAMHEIEDTGILIDKDLLDRYSGRAQEEAQRWERAILEMAGEHALSDKFCRSPKQLNHWLGYGGTSKDILGLHPGDDRAKALLEYRSWQRVEANYYTRLRDELTPEGRHHPSFRITGTVTGRPSCSGLNWFGIPKGSEDITAALSGVKQLVIPPEGYVLAEFDLSQAEIRALAHYMQQFDPDCMLFDILKTGESYHDRTAKETGLPRPVAKALNLSAQYGIGARALAKKYGYALNQARAYLYAYHKSMPGVKLFSKAAEERAKSQGFIRIADGRLRRFSNVGGKGKHYTAANNLCQGMIAGRIRRAIVRTRKEVPEFIPVLNVYDSMIGYLPENNWREPAKAIKAILEEKIWSNIQFKSSFEKGPNWRACKATTL